MTELSKDYAEALFALAPETQNEQAYADQLSFVSETLKQNEEFVALLRSPSVPLSERLQVVETVFSSAVDEYVLSFLMLLTEKGRMGEFFECETEYRRLLSCRNKTVHATVRSAKPLSDDAIAKLLAEAGFTVARRTVAKYRDLMHIPGASGRRRHGI